MEEIKQLIIEKSVQANTCEPSESVIRLKDILQIIAEIEKPNIEKK